MEEASRGTVRKDSTENELSWKVCSLEQLSPKYEVAVSPLLCALYRQDGRNQTPFSSRLLT